MSRLSIKTMTVSSEMLVTEGRVLGRDEVHVVSAQLDVEPSVLKDLYQILSLDERQRAERFRFQRDQDRFIASRGILRQLLGRYVDSHPRAVCFCMGNNGKPELAASEGSQRLRFNVSHSNKLALYAFTLGCDIGVDLEWMRADLDRHQLSQQCLSDREQARFRDLPAERTLEAFFTYWTGKEAYVKARGDGLSIPLHHIELSFSQDDPRMQLVQAPDARDPTHWSLITLTPHPGYLGALAVQGSLAFCEGAGVSFGRLNNIGLA